MAQVTSIGKFPFCPRVITNGSLVGQGTRYPIGFTENEMLQLYWYNKTYSCSYSTSLTIYNQYSPTCVLNFTSSLSSIDVIQSVNASSELNLVCRNNNLLNFYMGQRVADITDSCNGDSKEYQDDYISVQIYPSITYYYNNLYYPYIYINGIGSSSSDISEQRLPPYNNLSFSGSATFLGKSITLYSYWDDQRFFWASSASATFDISVSIICTDAWPYNP